jgi:hypothetical protein
MHKFLIYLSIYFCLTCFGLSFSPSSEADVQLRQWFKSPGYEVSARAVTPYPGDVMHFLFNLLRIKALYMFRALRTHPQEVELTATRYGVESSFSTTRIAVN